MSKILLNSDAMPFGLSFNIDSDTRPVQHGYSLDSTPWRETTVDLYSDIPPGLLGHEITLHFACLHYGFVYRDDSSR